MTSVSVPQQGYVPLRESRFIGSPVFCHQRPDRHHITGQVNFTAPDGAAIRSWRRLERDAPRPSADRQLRATKVGSSASFIPAQHLEAFPEG